jgi:hypothetical protein
VKEFKFSFDIFQKITQKYFLLASFTPYFKNQQTATSFLNESPQTYTDSSPPPLGTLQFLQRICIWRI